MVKTLVVTDNVDDASKQIIENIKENLEQAIEISIYNIVNELPKGHGSSIAKDLFMEKINENEYGIYITSPIWDYLNFGTGVFSQEHAGKGPGGKIIPINGKALHFKNSEIAMALGFPDENVFLKSVKGIYPRRFFERHFLSSQFDKVLKSIK